MLAELRLLHASVFGVIKTPHDRVHIKLCEGVTVSAHEIGDRVAQDGPIAVDVHAVEQIEEILVMTIRELTFEGV